jgi:hypothetical protein
MARVHHVKRAQQRYYTKPVIDPETGEPKRVQMKRRDGTPKMTRAKAGREPRAIFMTITEDDKSRPKPNLRCDKCSTEIKVGDPYKWVKTKSTYGGTKRVRCAACPTWQQWELSSSLSARVAQVVHGFWQDFHGATIETADEVTDMLNSLAEEVRGLAEEKREGASNIEEGFGHPTFMSDELNETADQLDTWAEEIESADIPEAPEPEEQDCDECGGTGSTDCDECGATGQRDCEDCDGTGYEDGKEGGNGCGTCDAEGQVECEQCDGGHNECTECGGTGQVTPEEPTEEQLEEWRGEIESAVSIVDECPV